PDAEIEILVDGRRSDAAPRSIQSGQRFLLILPSETKRLRVLASSPAGQASWSLSFAREGGSDLLREVGRTLHRVHEDIMSGRLATARTTLQSVRLPSEAPAESRYEVHYYRALLAEKEGDYRTAMAEVQEAVEIAERVKLERYRWMAEQKQGLLLLRVGRFSSAVQLFERLRRESFASTACEEAQVPANQAWAMLLAREAGERFGDPTPLLETALATFKTCEKFKPSQRMNILIDLALAHLQEGRLAQAKDLLAQARGLDPDPPLPHMLWWLDLEARIALKEGRPTEALRLFGDIEKLASATSSPDDRLLAAFGKAQSQRALGEWNAALEILQKAEALLDEQSLQIPLHEGRETFMATRHAVVNLHVELLLDQGRNAEAFHLARHARSRLLRQLERSHGLASLPLDQRARWERHLAEYHKKRAALEQRAKDEWTLPTDQVSRAQAVRNAEAAAVKKILDQAFQVLPRESSKEEPPVPRPGELILAYHPLSQGWAGFAADGKTVQVHLFELPPDLSRVDRLSGCLLLPFRVSIERAERIRILPSGSLQGVDFHALPFDGDVLLAQAPVVYGLDLPASPAPATVRKRHALLVADTRDDLRGALDESRNVLEILKSGSHSWIAEELTSADASVEAVRERLVTADLLHYAGHGSFSGSGGWDSSLLLAEETQLTLGDLLALDRVPAWVVLSACDTGRSSTKVPVESLGLAQAFLLAGSRAVIASTRPVKDRDLPSFFPELYREWDRGQDLAVALQRAQISWRKRNPRADWQSFRLFEP
ncbi:MAG TPA: CHAT domain-containing protein, partial [Thermoanaerobaculia bacterium]|nr:CHAT domain-containing protein [Thermoanaerobaculia bacterium]